MLKNILIISSILAAAYGSGQLSILHTPKSILFKGGDKLEATDLSTVITASLGYSIEKPSSWNNMFILDPFNTPVSAVAVIVDGVNSLDFSGIKPDITFPVVNPDGGESLNVIASRVQEHSSVAADIDLSHGAIVLEQNKNVFGDVKFKVEKNTVNLKPHDNTDHKLILEQIAVIDALADAIPTLKNIPSYIGLRVSLTPLVNDTAASTEALKLLTTSIEKLTASVDKATRGNALVLAFAYKLDGLRRARRAAATKADPIPADLNLAKTYSDDYPVIFNIILWFGVVIAFSLLAISYAIATMDPGRDSIIYRMTSTRIKKDN